MDNVLNDCYSPHTGEHIDGATPAPWMGRAGVMPPEYDAQTHGCFWRDGAWAVEEAEPEPTPVPDQVSVAQGTVALIQAGFWDDVLAFVASIPDPVEKAMAEVALNKTTYWQRNSPFLNQAAAAIGLTSGQLDALFINAAQIEL